MRKKGRDSYIPGTCINSGGQWLYHAAGESHYCRVVGTCKGGVLSHGCTARQTRVRQTSTLSSEKFTTVLKIHTRTSYEYLSPDDKNVGAREYPVSETNTAGNGGAMPPARVTAAELLLLE